MIFSNDHIVQLIMVSYFRAHSLTLCVQSIIANTHIPFKLAIIDNSHGGIDATLNTFTDERITVYKNLTNLGKGKAFMKWYNTITSGNQNTMFVSIDPDLIVPIDWLTRMLDTAYGVKDLAFLAPTLIAEPGDTFAKQLARDKLVMHKKTAESHFVSQTLYRNRHIAGPLLLINGKFFQSIGGYDQTQLYGNDDGELCKAAMRRNKLTGIVTDVEVLHLNDDTTEYKKWKKRNVRGNIDQKGLWD